MAGAGGAGEHSALDLGLMSTIGGGGGGGGGVCVALAWGFDRGTLDLGLHRPFLTDLSALMLATLRTRRVIYSPYLAPMRISDADCCLQLDTIILFFARSTKIDPRLLIHVS